MSLDDLLKIAPIVISILAFLVSGISLGWNIYRDVILKPRLKIIISNTLAIVGHQSAGNYLAITVANSGPGAIKIKKFTVKIRGKVFSQIPKNTFLMTDPSNPHSAQLPTVIQVGTDATFYLPWNEKALFSDDPKVVNVGAVDVYDRIHWADGSSFLKTEKIWHKEFGKPKNTV